MRAFQRRLRLRKRLEDAALRLGVDSDAGVGDFDADVSIGFADGDAESAAALHGVAGVEEEVEEDLLELAGVAANLRESLGERDFEADAGLGGVEDGFFARFEGLAGEGEGGGGTGGGGVVELEGVEDVDQVPDRNPRVLRRLLHNSVDQFVAAPDRLPQVVLRGHVPDRILNENAIEVLAEPHDPHVTLDVRALGVEGAKA